MAAYTTIDKPGLFFNTKIWSGNSSTQAITGVGFRPDMVWGKQRTGSENHQLLDVLRGANNILVPNNDTAAVADSNILNSFDSDGFTLGNQDQLNDTGANYVGWSWIANGSGSSNTAGSINTAYTSANTTSGFSISTFTGTGSAATVGHGLGVAPRMIIIKYKGGDANWGVYHESLGNTGAMFLDINATAGSSGDYWNSTTPTSTVFTINTSSGLNYNGGSMIAYCFSQIQGFSKFNSYLGNGNANGPICYTGFKPAFVMVKNTQETDSWTILDNRRDVFPNPHKLALFPDTNGSESGDYTIDFLANGFKVKTTSGTLNNSNKKYIYWAIAENPLVTSTGVPALAE